MDKIKEELKKYKWVFVIGLVVAIIAGIAAANIKTISAVAYKFQGNTTSMIQLLKNDVASIDRQDKWYFKLGMNYLVEGMEEESKTFFEEHFPDFIPARQKEIIVAYNKKGELLGHNQLMIQLILENLQDNNYKSYLKRMEADDVDAGLAAYYGNDIVVNETLVNTLYELTSTYPKKLPYKAFQFNLYDLLVMEGENIQEKKTQIFSKLESVAAKEALFKELKTQEVDGDVLKGFMDFLSETQIIDTKEYNNFNNLYSEVYVIRKKHSTIDEREINLRNKKESIEIQIQTKLDSIEMKNKELATINQKVSSLESELGSLTDYALMALYIEKAYGNGEYEASIPKKGLWGNYKPSGQKFIVKLTNTEFYTEGVFYVDVYQKGTKVSPDNKEYPYYVEVSNDELTRIQSITNERASQLQVASKLNSEIAALQSEVDTIKKENGYDENEKALQALAVERESYTKSLEEISIQIKNLLGISKVTIPLEAKVATKSTAQDTAKVAEADTSVADGKEIEGTTLASENVGD